jgi:hypothetical protein
MSRREKRIERLKELPSDFTWDELCKVLDDLEYEKISGAGSRCKFYCSISGDILSLHRPHPGKIVKRYMLKQVYEHLRDHGKI